MKYKGSVTVPHSCNVQLGQKLTVHGVEVFVTEISDPFDVTEELTHLTYPAVSIRLESEEV